MMRSALGACPVCGEQYDEGETICLHCSAQLPTDHETRQLRPILGSVESSASPPGSSLRSGEAPSSLHIEGVKVPLPFHDNITLGRPISQSDAWQTHVDLTPFNAYGRGVSRRHIRLVIRHQRAYVSDLSSTNGTWLNGQRLTPFHEYLLHDGVELRLGLLNIKIRF